MRPSFSFKRALLGRPLATAEEESHRLSKKIALPVFSSDAISSTAYATEEIMLILVLAGTAALHYAVPIALMVAALLAIVALSYQQTVHAYPGGGGSYVVGSENLGRYAGLVAGASLMVDYVMTVAVSVASGVAAITAAFPSLFDYRLTAGRGPGHTRGPGQPAGGAGVGVALRHPHVLLHPRLRRPGDGRASTAG